jgi:hypothetical protein
MVVPIDPEVDEAEPSSHVGVRLTSGISCRPGLHTAVILLLPIAQRPPRSMGMRASGRGTGHDQL